MLGTSNPGTASATVGGVGRNIAENLARLGRPTVLVAAVGDDPAGETVVARTSAAGVECRHVVLSPHSTGTYAAVLDDGGDLHIAVADMRATDELTVADLAVVPTLLAGADALVVDANLDATVIRWLLSAAQDAGVRSVFEPVSVAKATAAAPVLDGSVRVHTVTPNVDELAALVGHPVADTVDAIRAAADVLHAAGVEHVWVRRGTRGSLLSVGRAGGRGRPDAGLARRARRGPRGRGRRRHRRRRLDDRRLRPRPARRRRRRRGRAYGQVLAALTCASADTVRPDLTAALVAAHLTPTQPAHRGAPR